MFQGKRARTAFQWYLRARPVDGGGIRQDARQDADGSLYQKRIGFRSLAGGTACQAGE